MSTSMDELVACPFCGADARYDGFRCAVVCTNTTMCAVRGPTTYDRSKGIERWNTRAATPKAGVERGAVAWRVRNDFGHWYITQDKAMADTYRDIEKLNVEPLYTDAILSLSVGEQEIVQASIPDGPHSNEQSAQGLSRALRRLIIAARVVAYQDFDRSDLHELDMAVEEFSEDVPWEESDETLLAEATR